VPTIFVDVNPLTGLVCTVDDFGRGFVSRYLGIERQAGCGEGLSLRGPISRPGEDARGGVLSTAFARSNDEKTPYLRRRLFSALNFYYAKPRRFSGSAKKNLRLGQA
jgi:hypothetical protein